MSDEVTGPVVVMGVSGSGKSTVGRALAERLSVPFEDGDDLHPRSNVDKMVSGVPLDDDDRRPWLDAVGRWLAGHPDGVVACSALKRAYRDQLRDHAQATRFLHLAGRAEVIEQRQRRRKGHFMPVGLLDSQFATLEPLAHDEAGVTVDVDQGVEQIVDEYVAAPAAEASEAAEG